MIDLEKLKALTGEMAKPSRENSFERLEFTKVKADMKGYKLFYPAGQTRAKLKILYNVQTGLVGRAVTKHQFTYAVVNGKRFKVNPPCLKQYGMECPVCNVTKNIVDIKGKEVLQNTHRWTQKFISFAYIEEISGHPETDAEKKVNPGDIVLFMYPNTIFKKVNEIIERCVTSGDPNAADKFFAQNESVSFLLSVDPNAAATDMYNFMPDAISTSKVYNTPDGDAKFVEMLNSLPSLYDIYLPAQATDEIIALNKETADELSKRFLSNNTPDATTAGIIEGEIKKQEALQQAQVLIQPIQSQPIANPVVNPIVNTAQEQSQAQVVQQTLTQPIQPQIPVQQTIAQAPVQPTVTTTAPVNNTPDTSKPECFGNYNDIDAKCLICPHSTECSTKK